MPQLHITTVLESNLKKLESCQRRAAIAVIRAYRPTSTEALLDELGWPKLEDRRIHFSQILLYKMVNGLPTDLLPARHG